MLQTAVQQHLAICQFLKGIWKSSESQPREVGNFCPIRQSLPISIEAF